MKLPNPEPLVFGTLTKEQFDSEIEKGMEDIRMGNVMSADETVDSLTLICQRHGGVLS